MKLTRQNTVRLTGVLLAVMAVAALCHFCVTKLDLALLSHRVSSLN